MWSFFVDQACVKAVGIQHVNMMVEPPNAAGGCDTIRAKHKNAAIISPGHVTHRGLPENFPIAPATIK